MCSAKAKLNLKLCSEHESLVVTELSCIVEGIVLTMLQEEGKADNKFLLFSPLWLVAFG